MCIIVRVGLGSRYVIYALMAEELAKETVADWGLCLTEGHWQGCDVDPVVATPMCDTQRYILTLHGLLVLHGPTSRRNVM